MITAKMVGDDAVLMKMRSRGAAVRNNVGLRETIQALAIQVQRLTKEKLSGEVLKNRTGHLRSSINQEVMEVDGSIVAVIGTNVSYAARHEYGFQGTEVVSAHIRRSRAQMAQATYTYTNKRGVVVTKTRQTGKYGKGGGVIQVRSFERKANTPERSFLRSSLRDLSGTIRSAIAATVMRMVK